MTNIERVIHTIEHDGITLRVSTNSISVRGPFGDNGKDDYRSLDIKRLGIDPMQYLRDNGIDPASNEAPTKFIKYFDRNNDGTKDPSGLS